MKSIYIKEHTQESKSDKSKLMLILAALFIIIINVLNAITMLSQ